MRCRRSAAPRRLRDRSSLKRAACVDLERPGRRSIQPRTALCIYCDAGVVEFDGKIGEMDLAARIAADAVDLPSCFAVRTISRPSAVREIWRTMKVIAPYQ